MTCDYMKSVFDKLGAEDQVNIQMNSDNLAEGPQGRMRRF